MIFGEDDSRPQPPPQSQRIRLDASQMETVYANFFALAGSAEEVALYLGANSALPGVQEPVARISHRLILLPQNAKRLMIALEQTIKAHEERFGPIEIPPPPRPPG
jgi:hypothetical protein